MRIKLTWLLAVLLSLPLAILPSVARAVSAYDDVVHSGSPTIPCAGAVHNLGTTYVSIIDTPTTSAHNTFMAYLEAALDEGQGWALVEDDYGSGYGELTLWVSTTPSMTEAYFRTVYGIPYLSMNNAVKATIYCNGGTAGSPNWGVDYNNGNVTRELAQSVSAGAGFDIKPVYVNIPINYPEDYEGELISAEPPAPPAAFYNGTIDCGDTDAPVVSMTIAQPGNNGTAELTYPNPGHLYTAEWGYTLREDLEYSFVVVCGTKTAAPVGTVDATAVSNDWICDVVASPPNYCVLF
jgi:hypothetical protein